ncbi:MAG: glycosyltransferase family 39 protein [Phycisphaerales bacterium]|nr:glycosyltransferase family 39 protein [Phycisphaerales bacterium]
MARHTMAWFGVLLLSTAALSFYHLDGGAGFEPVDAWVGQTAREMYEGEFPRTLIVPTFSAETRMQKSPGPYWAVMLTAWVRGQATIDEVATRIPNAFAALLLVATLFWLTWHIAGDRPAIFAGFAASASVCVLWWSHRGASDLGLTACTTLSLAALWVAAERCRAGAGRNALFLLAYFAAGVGMLYKMPMPLAVVGVPALLYVLVLRRWSVLAHWVHLVGLAVFLVPWLPWALAAAQLEHAALHKWLVEYLDRYTGDLPNVEDQGGWKYSWYYLPMPLAFCLPWSLSLPGALARVFRRDAFALPAATTRPDGGGDSIGRRGRVFMLLWFVGLLVFFTASTGKEWRYFLPALPPLFVLLGIELAAFFGPRPAGHSHRLARLGVLGIWIGYPLAVGVGLTIGLRKWWAMRGQFELDGLVTLPTVAMEVAVAAALLYIALAVSAWLYLRGRTHASFGCIVVGMFALWLWAWPMVMPRFLSQRPFRDFATQLVEHVPAEQRSALRMIGTHDPRINWFGDLRFPRIIDQLALLREQVERVQNGQQTARRDLDYELQRYGEEIIRGLRGTELVLYVFPFESYVLLIASAPAELAARDEAMPPHYLWLQTRYGNFDRQMLLVSNRPPPFPAPPLRLPEKLAARLQAAGAAFPIGASDGVPAQSSSIPAENANEEAPGMPPTPAPASDTPAAAEETDPA